MTCAHAAQANLLLDGLQNVLKMVCRRFSKKVLPQLMGLQMKIFVFPVPDVNRSNTSPPNSVPDILFIFWKTSLVGPPYQQIFDCEPEQINLCLNVVSNKELRHFKICETHDFVGITTLLPHWWSFLFDHACLI